MTAAAPSSPCTLLTTPLHALHLELGARMVPFAGYSMPVQYPAGLMAEHLHTRQAAGLFDVSHMGQLRLTGMDAAAAFESLVPVDVIGLGLQTLMAVPFFILAAELMSGGSLTEVLLKFAGQFVGHKRGGLGYTNVVALTFFSGISGSALADAAGPGSMMINMMDKAGYDRSYATALTASTAIVGPIIPPSIIMIINALAHDDVSKVPLTELTRELKPFLIAHGVVLVLLTFVPALSNWLPHVMGFK